MSKRYLSTLLIITVLSAITAFLPLITGLKQFLPQNPTSKEILDTLITFLGVYFTLATLIFGVGINLSLIKSDANDARIEAFLTEIRHKLGLTSVQLLHDYEFYPHFRIHTEAAERSVDISYFESTPPGEPGSEVKNEYYRRHFEYIRQNHKVVFRRILRDSPANKKWIGEITSKELHGVGNAEIAIYRECGSKEMPLPLSVQLVDAKKTWFVAVATHGRAREPRDIFIENDDIAKMMEKYYNRLWERSIVVFRHGGLTPDGVTYLQGDSEKRNE